jgi:glutamyl-tRNA reductase
MVYVPTCQRVVVTLLEPPADAAERMQKWYAATLGRSPPVPEIFGGLEAFQHLAEAASSLDSLVVGEPQVLGQFKAAQARCDESGLSGPAMRHVFSLVFRTAKAVRSETALFRGKVSLVPLTEALVETHLMPIEKPRAAILGTGQIGEKMAEMLRRLRPDVDLHVVSRNVDRAHEVAETHGATGHTLAQFLDNPPARLDVLALAMGTDAPLLSAKRLEAMAMDHPLLVLDLAIPRNAEPAPGVPNLRLVQMDELSAMSEAAKADRHGELDAARLVLRRELDRVQDEYEARRLAHDLAALHHRFQAVAAQRLAEVDGALAQDPDFAKWYEQTVRALLHEATAALKQAGCERRAK